MFRTAVVLTAYFIIAFGYHELARASDQFAVIRPQLQFDGVDSWSTYPGLRSSSRHARVLAASRAGSRRFSTPSSSRNEGSVMNSPATGRSRRRGVRKASPFEATGATPLLRDLPADERHPPPTRRRALGW